MGTGREFEVRIRNLPGCTNSPPKHTSASIGGVLCVASGACIHPEHGTNTASSETPSRRSINSSAPCESRRNAHSLTSVVMSSLALLSTSVSALEYTKPVKDQAPSTSVNHCAKPSPVPLSKSQSSWSMIIVPIRGSSRYTKQPSRAGSVGSCSSGSQEYAGSNKREQSVKTKAKRMAKAIGHRPFVRPPSISVCPRVSPAKR